MSSSRHTVIESCFRCSSGWALTALRNSFSQLVIRSAVWLPAPGTSNPYVVRLSVIPAASTPIPTALLFAITPSPIPALAVPVCLTYRAPIFSPPLPSASAFRSAFSRAIRLRSAHLMAYPSLSIFVSSGHPLHNLPTVDRPRSGYFLFLYLCRFRAVSFALCHHSFSPSPRTPRTPHND